MELQTITPAQSDQPLVNPGTGIYLNGTLDPRAKKWGKRVAFRFMSSNMHWRRKYGIASDETDCAFIPKHARSQWPDKTSIAFATHNRQWKPDRPMDPGIMRTATARGNRGAIGAGGENRSGNRAARLRRHQA